MFESIPEYKKIVFSMFLIQSDKNLIKENGFGKKEINLLNLDFKNIFIEAYDEYLDFVKIEEESLLERFSNKQMEAYFNTIFEDVRHERSLILILSLTEPDILERSKFIDHKIEIIKNTALEKTFRQKNLEKVALDLLEKQFSD